LVCRFYAHLAGHWETARTISAIAASIGISVSRLGHVVHGASGLSLKQCQMKSRVLVAQELLRTSDDKLESIAALLGFSDASHFSRVFLRFTGMRPSVYRALRTPK
jgi:transcriptional regulator GlxA family with amidase domain